MSDRTRTKEAEAEKRGVRIVIPAPNELFIDIDSAAAWDVFHKHFPILNEIEGGTCRHSWAPSPSGEPGHFHFTVTLGRHIESETERLALQAMLGSDITREILSYREMRRGDPIVTVFFEKDEDITYRAEVEGY